MKRYYCRPSFLPAPTKTELLCLACHCHCVVLDHIVLELFHFANCYNDELVSQKQSTRWCFLMEYPDSVSCLVAVTSSLA